MFFKKYVFGDTAVYYAEVPVEGHEGKTTVGFAAYPKEVPIDPKRLRLDGMIQVAFTGDETLADYTRGVTMRNHDSTLLKVLRQTEFSDHLNTYLSDGAGNEYVHRLFYDERTGVFTVDVRYENMTKEPRTIEYLAGLSLGGIGSEETGTYGYRLYRMTSAWSRECRLREDGFAQLGLEMSWSRYGVKCERWGEVGGMPNRGYFPFAAIASQEDVVWAFMADAPASWQMEVYQEKETCAFSAGLADFETGHWSKTIAPNGSFTTHAVRFCVKKSVLEACNAFVHEADSRLHVPESEEDMPVLYNEYCATWGAPTQKKAERQLAAVEKLGLGYFVIDAGWYRAAAGGTARPIGDWNIDTEAFPDLHALVEKIKSKGMKAGIWFEFENTGRGSEVFGFDSVHLHRGGKVITNKNRRALDLRDPEVKEYLDVKMVDLLKEYGFEYLKIDYNDTYGIGCDSPDGASYGEGGRRVAEESIAYLDRLKAEIPSLVIENCASGGSRIEPLRMSKVSMCSFSDAHECPEVPLIAANITRVVPARQVQIWAVLRKNEDDARTIYTLCAAMMGRICLSGEIPRQKEKSELLQRGLAFYSRIKDVVRRGEIAEIDCTVQSYRVPKGRQVYIKDLGQKRLVIVHFLDCEEEVMLSLEGYGSIDAFTDLSYEAEGDVLKIQGKPYSAGAFLLEQ